MDITDFKKITLSFKENMLKHLIDIQSNKDELQTTIFLNKKTFTELELQYYPYEFKKTYHITFDKNENNKIYPELTIYAVSDKALIEYLKLNYLIDEITDIDEIITTIRGVDFQDIIIRQNKGLI